MIRPLSALIRLAILNPFIPKAAFGRNQIV